MSTSEQTPTRPPRASTALERWRARLRKLVLVEPLTIVQRELEGPIPEAGTPEEGIEFRQMTLDDVEVLRAECAHKIELYTQRLKAGRPSVCVCLHRGQLVAYVWFAGGDYHEPKIGYTFRTGDGGVYMFEGWTSPAWRKRGVAKQFLVWLYTRELPRRRHTHVISYFHSANAASRGMHDSFGYRIVGTLLHVRVLGRHFVFERRVARPRATS